MRKKRTRLRTCGRWGVWVCTGLMIALVPVSIWVKPSCSISYVQYDDEGMDRLKYLELRLDDGVVRSEFFPYKARGLWSRAPIPGWDADVWLGTGFPPTSRWWSFPMMNRGGSSVGPYTWMDMPIIYPTALLLGWSIWLIRGQRKYRQQAGCCSKCQYSLEGLNSDVCPECGEGHDA